MSDNNWMNELKRGDHVFVRSGYTSDSLKKHTVKNITPKGFVRIDNDMLFRDGFKRIDQFNSYHLIQWTQEKDDELHAKLILGQKINVLRSTVWHKLRKEQIDKIYQIVAYEN